MTPRPGGAVLVLRCGAWTAGSASGCSTAHGTSGDFDWGGLRIAQTLVDRVAATPWRFDAASYRAATGSHLAAPLRGTPTDASWDPDLADAMREVGRQVEEEAVVDDRLADLRRE